MAVELVTGHSGSAHVSSQDAAHLHEAVFGKGTFAFDALPEITMTDANTLAVGGFEMMFQGRHVIVTGDDVAIASGTQSAYRKDAVMLRYENDGTAEGCTLHYVQGAPAGTAASAVMATTEYVGLRVDEGNSIVDVPLFMVALEGLTPTASVLIKARGPVSPDRFYRVQSKNDMTAINGATVIPPCVCLVVSDKSLWDLDEGGW